MKLKIRMFARARDLADRETVAVELPEGATVADLRAALGESCPPLRPLLSSLHVAQGTDYTTDDAPIDPNKEIACFPPVSGG